jgi:hypothetical protein
MAINRSTTKKELVEYLRDTHGVDMPKASKDELLLECSTLDGVSYEKMEAVSQQADTPDARAAAAERKIKIRISSSHDNNDPVFVGVNSNTYLIQRDMDVEVPASVVDVLRNASTATFKMIDNEMIPITTQNYPFSILSE